MTEGDFVGGGGGRVEGGYYTQSLVAYCALEAEYLTI